MWVRWWRWRDRRGGGTWKQGGVGTPSPPPLPDPSPPPPPPRPKRRVRVVRGCAWREGPNPVRVRTAIGRMVEEAFLAMPTSRGNSADMTKLPLFTTKLAVAAAIIFVFAGVSIEV